MIKEQIYILYRSLLNFCELRLMTLFHIVSINLDI